MNNKQLFLKSLNTLFYSWGSDTPPEVICGANELLEWYEAEYNVNLAVRFNEDSRDNFNYDVVIEAINNN